MKEDWFETKFINPRTAEGKPQTERLEYAKEFFESFGMQDERFSGAAMVGSTVKGSGHKESSDIDVVLFYYEELKQKWEPKRERFPGIVEPAHWTKAYAFFHDFSVFREKFKLRREKEGKKYFEIDIAPGMHNLAKFEISSKNILEYAGIFYEFSYPIIKTKNPHPLMPIEKTLNMLKEMVAKLSKEQKEKLLKDILYIAERFERPKKSFQEIFPKIDEEEYVKSRLQILKDQLQRKFDLVVEN